jgi:hypothetical protein
MVRVATTHDEDRQPAKPPVPVRTSTRSDRDVATPSRAQDSTGRTTSASTTRCHLAPGPWSTACALVSMSHPSPARSRGHASSVCHIINAAPVVSRALRVAARAATPRPWTPPPRRARQQERGCPGDNALLPHSHRALHLCLPGTTRGRPRPSAPRPSSVVKPPPRRAGMAAEQPVDGYGSLTPPENAEAPTTGRS